jgi:hypothetical protein
MKSIRRTDEEQMKIRVGDARFPPPSYTFYHALQVLSLHRKFIDPP